MSESTSPTTMTMNTSCCAPKCESKPEVKAATQPQAAAAAPAPATPKASKRQGRKR